jgi:threonyl-tRNA synthetase
MIMSNDTSDELNKLRHSTTHVMAQAVQELFPGTKITIGPPIEDGFYYDFAFGETRPTEADLPKIEAKMRSIVQTWSGFTRQEVSADEARKQFADNPYKLELINEFSAGGQTLTLYTSGKYTDLCRGGHCEKPSKDLQHFKLLSLAGAYWRGDSNNTMLTRVYGTCFPSKDELQAYVTQQEEAKKRDHRKLGKELGLFIFSELIGPGLPLWTPKGTIIRELLNTFVGELRKPYGYERVTIPHITKKELYETSGHWAKYADDLFKITTREDHLFAMKPMNCPHHAQIYDSEPRSYRDLPVRYAETTMVYRDEQSGELSGLSRVLSITQDDAHVFCRVSQFRQEAENVWNIIQRFYETFGFKLKPRLSRRDPAKPEKYLGKTEDWDTADQSNLSP